MLNRDEVARLFEAEDRLYRELEATRDAIMRALTQNPKLHSELCDFIQHIGERNPMSCGFVQINAESVEDAIQQVLASIFAAPRDRRMTN